MTPKEILIAARNLISDPKKWTKGAFARNINGEGLVDGYDSNAVCWCAVGAIEKVMYTDDVRKVVDLIRPHIGGLGVECFNDEHSHEEVLALFDKAVAEAA